MTAGAFFRNRCFFRMSGQKDGWSRLAKNLETEIDEELIEAYRGMDRRMKM
ncbi:MAG: hypothetical protein LWX52_13795 [Deltaproteobacteria bacterium]|nr:hypothetical protein [Deltaproteobacteria bacterium]